VTEIGTPEVEACLCIRRFQGYTFKLVQDGAVNPLFLGNASPGTIDRTVGQTPNRVPRVPHERGCKADRFAGENDLPGMSHDVGKLGDNGCGSRRHHCIQGEEHGLGIRLLRIEHAPP